MLLFRDVVFYFAHRLLHAAPLYARFHKDHHRFTAPFALVSQYCSLVEHAVANVGPFSLAVLVLRPHVTVAWAVLGLGLLDTAATHSGYAPLGAAHHDRHHAAFSVNFGAPWLDRLMGTLDNDGCSGRGGSGSKRRAVAATGRAGGSGNIQAKRT